MPRDATARMSATVLGPVPTGTIAASAATTAGRQFPAAVRGR
jgi:hypothetical protein